LAQAWEAISTTLRKAKVTLISPQQLVAAQKRGAVVVDIRPSIDYNAGRIPGAVSVEFLRLIQGWDVQKLLRRINFALFGMMGTEYNPEFLEELAAAVPRKQGGVILYCSMGGTLDPVGASEFGRQSRSLTAAFAALEGGFGKIQVLDGGYYAWKKADMEIEMDA